MTSIGEFDLIRRLAKQLPARASGVVIGIGDDCAVVCPSQGEWVLLTTDMLIEGVHFSTHWMSPEEIGRKAMRVNISDIAAMGGRPRFAMVSVGLPSSWRSRKAERLFQGIQRAAGEEGIAVVGGDTNASQKLIINIVLVGEKFRRRVITRSGARVGDHLYVTGALGDARLGLEALRRGKKRGFEMAIRRHFLPPSRVAVGQRLVRMGSVHSLIDLSDGFVGDLGHILEESGVGARVRVDQVPTASGLAEKASLLGLDPLRMVLAGGEDYELLFTASCSLRIPRNIHGVPITNVGTIVPQKEGLCLVDAKGRRMRGRLASFRHF